MFTMVYVVLPWWNGEAAWTKPYQVPYLIAFCNCWALSSNPVHESISSNGVPLKYDDIALISLYAPQCSFNESAIHGKQRSTAWSTRVIGKSKAPANSCIPPTWALQYATVSGPWFVIAEESQGEARWSSFKTSEKKFGSDIVIVVVLFLL